MMSNFGIFGAFGDMSFAPYLIAMMLWSLFWKGLALWHSSRRKEPIWFVVLLIVNTAGILEIIYLFAVAKVKPENLFENK